MFARKFSSLGKILCPLPCRARNATSRPSSLPSTSTSLGSPKGVSTRSSRTSVSPGMPYSPLPPIIPISAFAKLASPRRKNQSSRTRFSISFDVVSNPQPLANPLHLFLHLIRHREHLRPQPCKSFRRPLPRRIYPHLRSV